MIDRHMALIQQLEEAEPRLGRCSALVGFDGFIDTLARPVSKTTELREENQYFETIEEFGRYLTSHKNTNCSVEMDVFSHTFGGNTPHLGNALATLGVKVSCVGTFGAETIDPLFSHLNCDMYSFADAGVSTALEFRDGKVMLGYHNARKKPTWDDVSACTKDKGIEALISNADLIALVNWSELHFSHELWKAVLTNCLELQQTDKSRTVFFDLCDIARKSAEEVVEVLELMGRFSQRRKTVLSMNENETVRLGQAIGASCDIESIAQRVHSGFGLDEVIVHTKEKSILLGDFGLVAHHNGTVPYPVLLTGAGDNFNGASCAAILLNLLPQSRLDFAAVFAHEYVRCGASPSLDAIRLACREDGD